MANSHPFQTLPDALLPPSAIGSQGLKDIFMITRLEMQPKIETKNTQKTVISS